MHAFSISVCFSHGNSCCGKGQRGVSGFYHWSERESEGESERERERVGGYGGEISTVAEQM